MKTLLLTELPSIFGVSYTVAFGWLGGAVSIGSPASTQRGSPPSNMLEFLCPRVLNMNKARGDEKTPWASYLEGGSRGGVAAGQGFAYRTTCVDGEIPSFSGGEGL